MCELDDQVNYVTPYTWQQRECEDCAFKATKKDDPDNPSMKKAISGDLQSEFRTAMRKEIDNLRKRKTWKEVKRSEVPEGAKVIPTTWAFKIKRYPDGSFRTFKARFCVRGDL